MPTNDNDSFSCLCILYRRQCIRAESELSTIREYLPRCRSIGHQLLPARQRRVDMDSSNKGLFSYDGYSTQQHFTYGERNNTRIYCGIIADNTYLYLGTDNGILVYNYRTDKYEQPETDFPTDVRTMALQGDTLWIGSLNGLYTYQLNTKKLASLDRRATDFPITLFILSSAQRTIRYI